MVREVRLRLTKLSQNISSSRLVSYILCPISQMAKIQSFHDCDVGSIPTLDIRPDSLNGKMTGSNPVDKGSNPSRVLIQFLEPSPMGLVFAISLRKGE